MKAFSLFFWYGQTKPVRPARQAKLRKWINIVIAREEQPKQSEYPVKLGRLRRQPLPPLKVRGERGSYKHPNPSLPPLTPRGGEL